MDDKDFEDFADFDFFEDNFLEDQQVWQSLWDGLKTTALVFGLIALGMVLSKVFP